jgi:hypothetical protein
VDVAVAEMSKASDFIKAHPTAQNDAGLMDMANRLSAAATALSGADPNAATAAAADTSGSTTDTSGTPPA